MSAIPPPPAQLRACPDRPPVPGPDAGDAEVAAFLARLAGAHHACATTLDALVAWVDTVRAAR